MTWLAKPIKWFGQSEGMLLSNVETYKVSIRMCFEMNDWYRPAGFIVLSVSLRSQHKLTWLGSY